MTQHFNQECTFNEIKDTAKLQIHSVVVFAGALGYEPVFHTDGGLLKFKSERQREIGQEYLSVNTMISLHNRGPGIAIRMLQDGDKVSFNELYRDRLGEDLLTMLFAGTCKVVTKAHLTYSKKSRDFIVNCHKINFMSNRDYAQFKSIIE